MVVRMIMLRTCPESDAPKRTEHKRKTEVANTSRRKKLQTKAQKRKPLVEEEEEAEADNGSCKHKQKKDVASTSRRRRLHCSKRL